MSKTISEAMNVLPRLGYRWLKLNDYRIEEKLEIPLKAYTNEYLPQQDMGISLRKSTASAAALKLFTKIPFGVSDELVELVEASFNAGIDVFLPAQEWVDEPLFIRYNLDDENDSLLDLNLIVAERNSRMTVVIEYSSDTDRRVLHTGVTKILAEEGAEVDVIKIQRLNDNAAHFDSIYVEASPHAKVRFFQVELGSKYSVTNYVSRIADNAEAVVKSMYLGDGERVLDLSYHMVHTGFRSSSNILVKGALKDHSRKVFRGTLDFRRGARLAEGNEEEYALLLDPTVNSNAIPLLLSEEDDIIGGHAASAGKVDADQLFYLMSRGLREEEATLTIVKASYAPILAALPSHVRQDVENEVAKKLVPKCTT